ncbi:MAG: hypothetical protein JXA33_12475 [Anaerolineae bacterium]|nr:hypothetical protein [Anaerolineae bacterium]
MTRYLQRLIARISNGSETPHLVPFIRTASGMEGGEGSDPFEVVTPSFSPVPTSLTPESPSSAPDRIPGQKNVSAITKHVVAGNVPTGVQYASPPTAMSPTAMSSTAMSSENMRRPALYTTDRQFSSPSDGILPGVMISSIGGVQQVTFESVPKTERTEDAYHITEEKRTSIVPPTVQPLAEGSDKIDPSRNAGTIARVLRRLNDAVHLAEQAAPPTPQDAFLPVRVPSSNEDSRQGTNQPPTHLRPLTPVPTPPTYRASEEPRVIIGRLSVEVVPTPLYAPQPTPTRPTHLGTNTSKRSEALPSKLRFGLGQS